MAKILVVDDDPGIREVCRIVLEYAGHAIREAIDGHEALDLIDHNRFDAVVLDLMMPRVDGFEVLTTLRSQPSTEHLPIVILTAKVALEDQLRCWREGATEFVTKPFPPEQLVAAIARAMSLDREELARRRLVVMRQLASHRPA